MVIDSLIQKKTGIKNCTFGELGDLINAKPSFFKHLHLIGVRLDQIDPHYTSFEHFSSEDSKWQDLIISDALTASMSLPGIFEPHYLHFKNLQTHEPYCRQDLGPFVSGNFFPISGNIFDYKRYVFHSVPYEGDHPCFNPATVNISASNEDLQIFDQPIKTFLDLLRCLYSLSFYVRSFFQSKVPLDGHRCIEINKQRRSLKGYDVTNLIELGKRSTEQFLREESHQLSSLFQSILQDKQRFHQYESPLVDFVGREDLLKAMQTVLTPKEGWSKEDAGHCLVLRGEEGVGTSELARYYADRHSDQYSFVYSIDSETAFSGL